MFWRSYKPEYPRSKEEFIEMIEQELEEHWFYSLKNDAPYDRYYNNQLNEVQQVKTIHTTFFYKEPHLRNLRIEAYTRKWYSYYEASDDLKSIPIPHIHFVKIIK